jgi:hypothetical protein
MSIVAKLFHRMKPQDIPPMVLRLRVKRSRGRKSSLIEIRTDQSITDLDLARSGARSDMTAGTIAAPSSKALPGKVPLWLRSTPIIPLQVSYNLSILSPSFPEPLSVMSTILVTTLSMSSSLKTCCRWIAPSSILMCSVSHQPPLENEKNSRELGTHELVTLSSIKALNASR